RRDRAGLVTDREQHAAAELDGDGNEIGELRSGEPGRGDIALGGGGRPELADAGKDEDRGDQQTADGGGGSLGEGQGGSRWGLGRGPGGWLMGVDLGLPAFRKKP